MVGKNKKLTFARRRKTAWAVTLIGVACISIIVWAVNTGYFDLRNRAAGNNKNCVQLPEECYGDQGEIICSLNLKPGMVVCPIEKADYIFCSTDTDCPSGWTCRSTPPEGCPNNAKCAHVPFCYPQSSTSSYAYCSGVDGSPCDYTNCPRCNGERCVGMPCVNKEGICHSHACIVDTFPSPSSVPIHVSGVPTWKPHPSPACIPRPSCMDSADGNFSCYIGLPPEGQWCPPSHVNSSGRFSSFFNRVNKFFGKIIFR